MTGKPVNCKPHLLLTLLFSVVGVSSSAGDLVTAREGDQSKMLSSRAADHLAALDDVVLEGLLLFWVQNGAYRIVLCVTELLQFSREGPAA